MSGVTVRHFTETDIPVRSALMREERFQANLSDFAVVSTDSALTDNQRATITSQHDSKRIFTLCAPNGETVGFAWISSIDWRSQACELSFGVLPRFRGAYGVRAVAAAQEYVRHELNMAIIVSQVLEHNTMLVPAGNLAARHQVRCTYDSFTVGEWRASCYWSETEQESLAERDRLEARRQELAARVKAQAPS